MSPSGPSTVQKDHQKARPPELAAKIRTRRGPTPARAGPGDSATFVARTRERAVQGLCGEPPSHFVVYQLPKSERTIWSDVRAIADEGPIIGFSPPSAQVG